MEPRETIGQYPTASNVSGSSASGSSTRSSPPQHALPLASQVGGFQFGHFDPAVHQGLMPWNYGADAPILTDFFPDAQMAQMHNCCELCGETFVDVEQLQTHRQTAHPPVSIATSMSGMQDYNAFLMPMNYAGPAYLQGYPFGPASPFTPQSQQTSPMDQMSNATSTPIDTKPFLHSSPSTPRAPTSTPQMPPLRNITNSMSAPGGAYKGVQRSITRRQAAPKPTECDLCGMKIKHKRNIYRHKRTRHNVVHQSDGNGHVTNKPYIKKDENSTPIQRQSTQRSPTQLAQLPLPVPVDSGVPLPLAGGLAPSALNYPQMMPPSSYSLNSLKMEPSFA